MQEKSQQRADAVGCLQDDDEGVAPHLLAVIVLHAAVSVHSDAGGHGASGHDRGRVSATHASAVDLTSVFPSFSRSTLRTSWERVPALPNCS